MTINRTELFSRESSADKPARVVLIDSGKIKEEFILSQDTTIIGRSATAGIRIKNTTVSKEHAQIHRRGDGFVLKDLGSLNGLLVDGHQEREIALTGGETIRMGDVELQFVAEGCEPIFHRESRTKGRLVPLLGVLAGGLVLAGVSPRMLKDVAPFLPGPSLPKVVELAAPAQIPLEQASVPLLIQVGRLDQRDRASLLACFADRIEAWNLQAGKVEKIWESKVSLQEKQIPLLMDVDQDGLCEIVVKTRESKIVCLDGDNGAFTPWEAVLPSEATSEIVACVGQDDIGDVAVGTVDGKIRILSGARYLQEERSPLQIGAPIETLRFVSRSETENLLVAGCGQKVCAMDPATGGLLWSFEAPGPVTEIGILSVPDQPGQVGCLEGTRIHFLNLATGELIATSDLPGPSGWPLVPVPSEGPKMFYALLDGGVLGSVAAGTQFSVRLSDVSLPVSLLSSANKKLLLMVQADKLLFCSPDQSQTFATAALSVVPSCLVAADVTGGGFQSVVALSSGVLTVVETNIRSGKGAVSWSGPRDWTDGPLPGPSVAWTSLAVEALLIVISLAVMAVSLILLIPRRR